MKLVFASYFTGTQDPQRKKTWSDNPDNVDRLITSVVRRNQQIVIFHDCFFEAPRINGCQWIDARDSMTGVYTASVLRWFRYLHYLNQLEQKPEYLFMVDSTDVEMLSDPFPHLKDNILYCGDEAKSTIGCSWLKKKSARFTAPDYNQVLGPFNDSTLLNAGIVGGHINICLEFLNLLTDYHIKYNAVTDASESMDMPAFNYTILKHFSSRIVHGDPVNTRFKSNQWDHTKWWKHK